MNELKSKILYLDLVTKVNQIAKQTGTSSENVESMQKSIEQLELLIPVVGEFSAGKSTLLNSFIGRNVLSVKVTPETAVATELRYSEEEYAEIVIQNGDDLVEKKVPVDEIGNVQKNWRNIRLYLHAENLKKIEPVVLVDMPGFDSPRDDHNRAIMSYLDKGVHYIVLTSVESGTITSSMSRQLQDIQNMGRSFSFFVSKANLRNPKDVAEIIEEIKNQAEVSLGIVANPKPIGKNGAAELENLLKSVNPDSLFRNIFKDPLIQLFNEVDSAIGLKISALKQDRNRNKAAIRELEEALEKLERRRDMMIAEAKSNCFEDATDEIVNSASVALSNEVERLTDMALNGCGSDTISQEMSAIVRSAVIPAVSKVSKTVSERISTNFQMELSGVEETFSALGNPEFIGKITSLASNFGDVAKTSLMNFSSKMAANASKSGAGVAYKAIVGTIGIATSVVAPVIEIVLLFLPEIISLFTKSSKERKQRENVRSQILNAIPRMKMDLRSKIIPILQGQNENAIKAISEQFDSRIKSARDNVQKANEELENCSDIVQKMQLLEQSKMQLQTLRASI